MDADQARLDAFEDRYQAKISSENKLKKLAESWHLFFQSPYQNAARQAHGFRVGLQKARKLIHPKEEVIDIQAWDLIFREEQRLLIADAQHVAAHPSITQDQLRTWSQGRPKVKSALWGVKGFFRHEHLEELTDATVWREEEVLKRLKLLLENLAKAWHLSFQSPFENAAKQAHCVRIGFHNANNIIPKKNGGMDIRAWDELDHHIRHGLSADAEYVAEHPSTSQDDLRIRYQDRWIAEADKQEAGDGSPDDLDEWDDPTLECEYEVLEKLKTFLAENLTLLVQSDAAKP
jgi:hypothetical protein